MARRQSLLDLLDTLAPQVAEAFRQSIQRITDDVSLRALEDAIRAGDIERAVELIRAERGYFRPLDEALAAAYGAGGDLTMAGLAASARAQGAQARGFFDPRNPRAERFVAQQSSRLITEISGDVRDTVRAALTTGMEVGTAPRTAALNLVGRINRATGSREGGIVGLTTRQAGWADAARQELLNGDPAYLRRAARDRRFDRTVLRAINEGRGVSAADADRITRSYRNGLLRYRGETIARTELLGSLHAAQDEALSQMMEREGLRPEAVVVRWDAASDGDTRETHAAADGQERQKGQPFDVGGYLMAHPGDRSMGAPAEEVINCRCQARVGIDFTSLLGPGD